MNLVTRSPTIWTFSCIMGTEADNRVASNESLFALIRSMSPERLAFARIACAWDDLNSQYSRNGCDAEFADKRRRLKRLIGSQIDRGAITRDSLAEWMSLPWHQDVVRDGRMVQHGYNFDYVKPTK